MKTNRSIITIMVLILLITTFDSSFSQNSRDYLERLKLVKEMYIFDKWEGETGKVISGIPFALESFPQLSDMKKVWNEDNYSLENRDKTDYVNITKWWRSNREELLVSMIVCPSLDSAKEYLISRYADTQEEVPAIKDQGSRFDLDVGNICFVTFNRENQGFSSIDFIRNNILFMIKAEGKIQGDLRKIAGTIDAQLQRKTPVKKLRDHPDNPRIEKLTSEKSRIPIGEKVQLKLEVKNETGGEIRYFWNMPGGGISKDYLDNFIYYGGEKGKQEITLTIVNELGLYDTRSVLIEVGI